MLGQKTDVFQHTRVPRERGGDVRADVDLTHRQQPPRLAGHLLQGGPFCGAQPVGQLQGLFVQDQLALGRQRQDHVAHEADHVGRIRVLGHEAQADDFLRQPPALLRVDLLVGAEQVERRAGVVCLVTQVHADSAAVVKDQFGDQGRGADVESAVLGNGHLDLPFLGISFQHLLTETYCTADVLIDERDGVLHQGVQQLLTFHQRLAGLRGGGGRLVDVTLVEMGEQRGDLEQVKDHAGLASQHGQVRVLALDLRAGHVGVVLGLEIVES